MKGCGVMPKEKINYAPQFIQELEELKCPNGCQPPAESCIACPGPLPVVEVGEIHWKPVAGAESPGAWVPSHKPATRDAELAVGWHRDSWVQVSIEGDRAYFEMAAGYPDAEDDRTSVYTPPLGRDEINKLIRTLRRARDQVFGRDE